MSTSPQNTLLYLNPAQLAPDPNQPRKHFDEEAFERLRASVRVSGVVQPLTARTAHAGNSAGAPYTIIAGERRWRAAKAEKLDAVPVILRDDLSEIDVFAMQIVENIQRADLTTQELVVAVPRLVTLCNGNVAEAARQLGRDRSWVSRINGVTKLWAPVQDLIGSGHIQSIDAAHDLSQLRDIDPDAADRLAKEFFNPPAHRPIPPNRELIRTELERARARATDRASQQREAQETSEARREQRETMDPAPLSGQGKSGPSRTVMEKARDHMAELRLACDRRATEALGTTFDRVAAALSLRMLSEDEADVANADAVDGDGVTRICCVRAPQPVVGADEDLLRQFDPRQGLWELTLELTLPELQLLADALEGKSAQPLPANFQSVRDFLDACTQPCPGNAIASAWLFNTYSTWAKRNKREAVENANEFAVALAFFGLKRKRSKQGQYWIDIEPSTTRQQEKRA